MHLYRSKPSHRRRDVSHLRATVRRRVQSQLITREHSSCTVGKGATLSTPLADRNSTTPVCHKIHPTSMLVNGSVNFATGHANRHFTASVLSHSWLSLRHWNATSSPARTPPATYLNQLAAIFTPLSIAAMESEASLCICGSERIGPKLSADHSSSGPSRSFP